MTLTALCLIGGLLAGSIYAIWLAHENDKSQRAEARRVELDRVMALTHNMGKRGPTGFQRKVS